MLNLEWVTIYIANNNWYRKNVKFSAIRNFHSANLLRPKRSIIWEFEERVKYIGIIIWLEEHDNFLEIIFHDLSVENFEGKEISKSRVTYIRVPVNKIRIDSFGEEDQFIK